MEPLPSFVISRAMAMGPYPTVPWLWSHGHMVATTLPGRSALTSRGYTWEQEILQTRIPQEVILVTIQFVLWTQPVCIDSLLVENYSKTGNSV